MNYWGICSIALTLVVPTITYADCKNEPILEFGERIHDTGGTKMEYLIVDGKQWKSEFLRSAAVGILRTVVLPDCRVAMVGRRGLDSYVVVNDVMWRNSVYNSSALFHSKDGKRIAQADDRGTILVNDVPQKAVPNGKLEFAGFNDKDQLEVRWKVGDKTVIYLDGKEKK